MNELGMLYTILGQYEDARSLIKVAVEEKRSKFGDDHPHTWDL
ncbi:MAG: tetratricopeptide repeat protein [Planctomycetota bacterium]|jgi:hypothetical protein